eukprot:Skav227797  [mRNA]  locus=scaffold948:42166:42430:+ [translate_table: standard]
MKGFLVSLVILSVSRGHDAKEAATWYWKGASYFMSNLDQSGSRTLDWFCGPPVLLPLFWTPSNIIRWK